jgi:hypothetical protein
MWLAGEREAPEAEAAARIFGEFVLRGLAYLKSQEKKGH